MRVLDLTVVIHGPETTSLLAEFGARVIKIEPPGGDPLREITPFGEYYFGKTGLNFLVEGRNKEFVTLNLEKEEGREIFRKLAKKADVVIESYPPGYLDELGIGYRHLREINLGLIYLCVLRDKRWLRVRSRIHRRQL